MSRHKRGLGGVGMPAGSTLDGVPYGRPVACVPTTALLRFGNRAMRRKALRFARKVRR